MGVKKYLNAIFKTATQNEIQKRKKEFDALTKRLMRLHRNSVLTPEQKRQIAAIRAQNAAASKGAEEAYQLTRIQLMTDFLKEEIDVYENRHQASPVSDERSPAGGAAEMAAGKA